MYESIAELQPVTEPARLRTPSWPTVAITTPWVLPDRDAPEPVTVTVAWSDGRGIYGIGQGLLVRLELPTRPECTQPTSDASGTGPTEPAARATILTEPCGRTSVHVYGDRRNELHPPDCLADALATAVTVAIGDRRQELVALCERNHLLALDIDTRNRIGSTIRDVLGKLAYLRACHLEVLATEARLAGRSARAETIDAIAATWEGNLADALVVIEELAAHT